MTAACADTESPVRQGLISMTGVFFDTTVICTVTGLAICCSGVLGLPDAHGEALTGAALTIRAFGTVLGPWAGWLVSVSLGLFAFTSVLGCAVQAETVISFLLGRAAVRPCQVLYGSGGFFRRCASHGNRTPAGRPVQRFDGAAESHVPDPAFRGNCRRL